jgi:hypothetical protein
VAASPTGELRLEIGKPDMIGPAIGIDDDRMRALDQRAPVFSNRGKCL